VPWAHPVLHIDADSRSAIMPWAPLCCMLMPTAAGAQQDHSKSKRTLGSP